MLVLTRKQNETLHIGDDIVITIVRARGNSIRIGIEAPPSINIQRGELVGKPAKQAVAPESEVASQPSILPMNRGREDVKVDANPTHASGPLSRFLKALPKVELAAAS